MIPLDTDIPIPYGFPIARTLSPIFRLSESAKLIDFNFSLDDIFRTAISVFLSIPIMLAG